MWVPAVTLIGIASVIGTTVVLRGPMGKALGEWIRGWSKTDEQWLAMKRLLARERDPDRLAPPR
jgi:hypothetical protein